MASILVIRGGAIGDFVLTLPAIRLIREQFPQARLEILGYRHIVELAHGRFYADAVRSIEYAGLSSFFIPNGKLPQEWVDYFAGFGQVISYLYDPDGFFEGNLRRAGVKHLLSAYTRHSEKAHVSTQLAQPLEQLALYLEPGGEEARLHPTDHDRALARQRLATGDEGRPLIAIHAGSGGLLKRWPLEAWLELTQWLATQPIRLLVIGGEAERDWFEPVLEAAGTSAVAAWALPLEQLAALLGEATLYLGHDTGISHIAAAVGTRSIVMFGPTRASVWAPHGAHVSVLEAPEDDLRRLPFAEVRAAVAAALVGSL